MAWGNWINVLLYLGFGAGLCLVFMDKITDIKYRAKVAYKMRRPEKEIIPVGTENSLEGRLFMLLKTTTKIKNEKYTKLYITANIIFGAAIFIVVQPVVGPVIGLIAGAAAACILTAILRTRLQNMRVTASREGEILVTELLNYYKIHYCNMNEAIEQAAYELKETPGSKRALMTLSNGLSTASSDGEIKKLLSEFNYSIGTSWAIILSNNMYFALTDGIRVTAALSDLTESIGAARKALEQNRRENNEAKLMLKYLVPISYLLTIIAANRFFDFSVNKFMEYQFATSTGLSWFMACVGAFVVSVIVMSFLSRVKMDL